MDEFQSRMDAENERRPDRNEALKALGVSMRRAIDAMERDMLAHRSKAAKNEKAMRGRLPLPAPVGFQKDQDGGLILDPDPAIRALINRIFEDFGRLGTAAGVVKALREDGVHMHFKTGETQGVREQPITNARVRNVLTNPTYAGIYTYGRSTSVRSLDREGHATVQRTARDPADWPVYLEGAFQGYITAEQYRLNQKRLMDNRPQD